jgi:hypothetical protein
MSALILALAGLPGPAALASADGPDAGAARYDAEGRMLFPADYRQWVFLSAGQNMSYSPAAQGVTDPVFDNVFVNPEAHAAFQRTGHWPDGTVMALEIRRGRVQGSINRGGAFQTGDLLGVEVHVRDSRRFEGGWAFFGFEPGAAPAAMIPRTASCYSCHQEHAAVDTTFVQFYPTLLPLAERLGTLSPAYLAEEAAARQEPGG